MEPCFLDGPGVKLSPLLSSVSICTRLGRSFFRERYCHHIYQDAYYLWYLTILSAAIQIIFYRFKISKKFLDILCSYCFYPVSSPHLLRFQKSSVLIRVSCNLYIYPSTPAFYILCAWALISEKCPARQQ